MTEEKVSIIIPAYNAADYIREAVDSALAQTYPDVEVVVVDDGSTDNTKHVLEPYISARKIKYVYEANKGLAGARDTGVKSAQGAYIAFLDADDLFLPEKVAEQVKVLEAHPDFGVCYSDLLHFTDSPSGVPEERKFYHHRYKYPSGDVFGSLLRRQFINPLAVMARSEVFEKYGYFDENLRRSEDWDLWLRWSRAGVKFYYLDKPLAHYRMRGVGNLSSAESEPAMKEKNLELFSRLGENLSEEEKKKYKFEKILDTLRLKTAAAYLVVGDKKSALRLLSGWPLVSFFARLLPAKFYLIAFGFLRRAKHRLLLKRT